jgi:hypothetical protein
MGFATAWVYPENLAVFDFSEWVKGIDGDFDRSKYLVCLTQQLEKALKRGDVFVERSIKYADPRARLLEGDIWDEVKLEVHQALGLPLRAKDFLEKQTKTLDARLKAFSEGMTENPNVKLKLEGDELKITLSPLEKLPDNEVLTELNKEVSTRLPEVGLAELLLEIDARTGFITAMLEPETVEVKDLQEKRMPASVPVARRYAKDLEVSMAAVFQGEACNIGLKSVSQEINPALTLDRLNSIKDRYLSVEAI